MLKKTKRILGIIIATLGIALLLTSFYIKSQVSSGRRQISESRSSVNRQKQLFSLTPATKELGKGFTDSAERQIGEGSAKADRYDTLALWFQIGGSVFIVIGAGLVIMSFINKKQKN
jgi:hypothetical protein